MRLFVVFGLACRPPEPEATTPTDSGGGDPTALLPIVPLHDASTALEPDWIVDRGDAIVTRFADRGRDRHAREDEFQSYDHYLPHYWEYRTARLQFTDYVAKGGATIDVSMVTEWRLTIPEFRAWYLGLGTVATYSGNYAPTLVEEGPGTFDLDHEQVSDEGTEYRYSFTMTEGFDRGVPTPLAIGQHMEFEASQFLDGAPGGRQNYYGTVGLYAVGVGGLVPWRAVGDFADPTSEREKSYPIDEAGWSGGRTTLPYAYSDEPDNHFLQMATNLSTLHGPTFVSGRRVHHTDMLDGTHDESAENGVFTDLVGLAGPAYVHPTCDGCHTRNGRAAVPAEGSELDRWVFKVAGADGESHPRLGRVLQPYAVGGAGEGIVRLTSWAEGEDGLRTPQYTFEGEAPDLYSGRIAPQLVGMGLLEAVAEEAVLAWEDPADADGDGISGRAQRVADPVTGDLRLGRFGWKAGTTSLRHQIAAALNGDMGVLTEVLPAPDCGLEQTGCGEAGPELAEAHFEDLVKYVALLGVRARRDVDDPDALLGEERFAEVGCAACHQPEVTTSPYHPLAEVRAQRIHPYTDLLLHDLGPGLADSLGEGAATGAEWRTAPLWGIGLGACVTGGVVGPNQNQTCVPSESYLHDGRARTLEEAIAWHGGEGAASRDAFAALTDAERAAVLRFLRTL